MPHPSSSDLFRIPQFFGGDMENALSAFRTDELSRILKPDVTEFLMPPNLADPASELADLDLGCA